MDERRRNIRVNDTLEIDCWPWKSLFLSSSVSHDISAGGISFPSLQRFEVSQQIGINIHTPEFKEPISARAEVVWLGEIENINYRYQIGAKFLKLSPSHQARLLHYLCAKLAETNPQ